MGKDNSSDRRPSPDGANSSLRRVLSWLKSFLLQRRCPGRPEKSFEYLFLNNPLPMWIYDLETLNFLDVNQAAIEQYGYSRDEFLSMSLRDIRPAEDVERLVKDIAADRPNLQHSGIWRHVRKDGEVIQVEITSHRLEFQGRDAAMVVARNVTLYEDARQALIESEANFRALFDSASEAIIIVDQTGSIQLFNTRAQQVFGYQLEEVTGQSIELLIPHNYREIHRQHRTEFVKQPHSRPMGLGMNLYGLRKDGREFPIEVSLSGVPTAEGQLVMALVTDISYRQQLEEEVVRAELMRMELIKEREIIDLKERFVSVVSHEFRNPLAGIMASASILERYHKRLSPERQREHVQRILSSSQEMQILLDEILELSRARSGKEEIQRAPINLRKFCDELITQIRELEAESHIIRLEIEAIDMVQLDPRVLRHVLANLLSNAIKYSPEGSEIRFHVHREADHIIFEVEDRGIGIPAEEVASIFEPFHRARNASTYNGTGLGLAIVKQKVELHGGTVSCQSQEGAGTVFTVKLPL
jgi:PAS domain S-box-containing protein